MLPTPSAAAATQASLIAMAIPPSVDLHQLVVLANEAYIAEVERRKSGARSQHRTAEEMLSGLALETDILTVIAQKTNAASGASLNPDMLAFLLQQVAFDPKQALVPSATTAAVDQASSATLAKEAELPGNSAVGITAADKSAVPAISSPATTTVTQPSTKDVEGTVGSDTEGSLNPFPQQEASGP